MKAFLVMLMIVSLGVAVHAQPQAPIEWGPIRLLMEADSIYAPHYAYGHGDTIVLTAVYGLEQPLLDDAPAACISGDNGLTWSPWHVFPYPGQPGYYTSQAAFTSQGVLCCTNTSPDNRSFYCSTDLGYTWTHRGGHAGNLQVKGARGDTVLCRGTDRGSVTWTTDGGLTFAPERQIDMPRGSIEAMALSGGMIHVVGRRAPEYPLRAAYSRGPFSSGAFTEPQWVNDVYFAAVTSTAFDENGVGVIASIVNYAPPIPRLGAVLANRTTDNGLNWSVADTFTAGETASIFDMLVSQMGPLWAVAWVDTAYSIPFVRGGAYCRFSANRGRSWYPAQQVVGDSVFGGDITDLEIREDHTRLYGLFGWWNGEFANHFFQWEGTIRRDTLWPVIGAADTVLSALPPDTSVVFACHASDSDSLWQVQVVLRRVGHGDSLVVPVVRSGGDHYSTAWTVPGDTGDWEYYYRAEDMWENVSYYPPEGPAAPWTFHVGPLSNSADFILHPSSFVLSVYPVPFNTTTHLEFTLPTTQRVSLRLYDVLGREVAVLMNDIQSAGQHHMMFDASGLPSGVYLCRLEAGEMMQTRKMVLIK